MTPLQRCVLTNLRVRLIVQPFWFVLASILLRSNRKDTS
jgi:hypothetical protein